MAGSMPVPEAAIELPDPASEQATWLDERVALLETRAGFPSAHSLLISDGQQTVLVDAGCGEELLAPLADEIDRIVLTHFHLDHVLHFPIVEDVPVMVPETERAIFEGQPFPAFVDAGDEAAQRFDETFGDIYPSFDLDPDTFEPGNELELAGTRWEIVPAPGHSPGHPLLHERGRSILFSVDVEFSGMGPWYAWPHCDPTGFEQAIESARDRFEQARVVATSHSPPIVEDPEAVGRALDGFLAHFEQRDEAVLAALQRRGDEGARVDELVEEVRVFYGEHVDKNPAVGYWCRVMTTKHLERLADRGRAESDGERWRARDG